MNGAGEIIVTLANTEKHYSYAQLGVTFASTDQELFAALRPVIQEEEGFTMSTDNMTVRRVDDSQNTFVFPKSPAGHAWGLQTYSDGLVRTSVGVHIRAAENGYVFKLTGQVKTANRAVYGESDVNKEFVYPTLEDGLVEVTKFFDGLEKSKDIKNVAVKVLVNGNIRKIVSMLPDDAKDQDKVTVIATGYLPDEIMMKDYAVEFESSKQINFKVDLSEK